MKVSSLLIHDAAKQGDLEKVKALLEEDPNLVLEKDSKDFRHFMPLHWAAQTGHKDVIDLRLAHGANVNAKDDIDEAPVHVAAQYGHKDVAELLRQHGGHE